MKQGEGTAQEMSWGANTAGKSRGTKGLKEKKIRKWKKMKKEPKELDL